MAAHCHNFEVGSPGKGIEALCEGYEGNGLRKSVLSIFTRIYSAIRHLLQYSDLFVLALIGTPEGKIKKSGEEQTGLNFAENHCQSVTQR